jgi:diaminopimelate epimerase
MAADLSSLEGVEFHKMSGSGNDFVFFDSRAGEPPPLDAAAIGLLCARGTGVGADGVVYLLAARQGGDVRMRYLNRDGSVAALCGNATLCAARLAADLGAVPAQGDFSIETDSGVLTARLASDGRPEIDLAPVREVLPDAGIPLEPGEERMGYALAGVPHLVIPVADLDSTDVEGRGAPLRHHPSLPLGANVNFLERSPSGNWRIRTYERGVEAETLACGTGAVASGILLTAWGLAKGPVEFVTRSGMTLGVRLREEGGDWHPSLSGAGRVVFTGRLRG